MNSFKNRGIFGIYAGLTHKTIFFQKKIGYRFKSLLQREKVSPLGDG